jgi:hypothetical protein
MMQKVILILFKFVLILFILQLNYANQTQNCEKVASLREELNNKLENFVIHHILCSLNLVGVGVKTISVTTILNTL